MAGRARGSLLSVAVLALVAAAGCLGGDGGAPCGPTEACSGKDPGRPGHHGDAVCPDGTWVMIRYDENGRRIGSGDPCAGHGGGEAEGPGTSGVPPATTGRPWYPSDGASVAVDLLVPGAGGHVVPATLHKPLVAGPGARVPLLLHSHGFGGARSNVTDAFRDHVAAGFAVLSFDQRGHGDARASSEIAFMHPDAEVADIRALIDEVATWDWVLMEGPGDPVLGAIGASYGGAFQLMAAAFDERIDAIVPEVTWNDITRGLAPNGAIKSAWVDLFYLSGNAAGTVTFGQEFHRGFAYATAANQFPAGQAPGVPDLRSSLLESSPVSYPGAIAVPTLLVQGMRDTLFPLNEAVANLDLVAASGAPTALYTHHRGHVLNTDHLRNGTSPQPLGLQGPPGPSPCGAIEALQIAWHQHHLLGLDTWRAPRVCLTLEDESVLRGPTLPLPGTRSVEVRVAGAHALPGGPAGPALDIPAWQADGDGVIVGIPRITGNITVAGAEAIVFFSIVAGGAGQAPLGEQVTPLRVAGPAAGVAFDIDLGAVAAGVVDGQPIGIRLAASDAQYFSNGQRVPGGVVLEDLRLVLPVVAAGG